MSTGPYPADALARLQAAELDVLLVVDEICRAQGITYFIDGGTCLGAVRHGGFIPWDDDVDIAMPLADFQRFCELAPATLPPGYSFHMAENTAGMTVLWAKVYRDGTRFMDAQAAEAGCEQAIFIDVFCYRQLSTKACERRRQVRRSTFWQRVSYLYGFGNPKLPKGTPLKPLVRVACKLAHRLIPHLWSRRAIRQGFTRAWRTNHPGELWVNSCYAYRAACDTSTLFPPVPRAFAGHELPAPRDADAYLTNIYGAYRELPPLDERYTHLPTVLDFGDGVNVMELSRSSVVER